MVVVIDRGSKAETSTSVFSNGSVNAARLAAILLAPVFPARFRILIFDDFVLPFGELQVLTTSSAFPREPAA